MGYYLEIYYYIIFFYITVKLIILLSYTYSNFSGELVTLKATAHHY